LVFGACDSKNQQSEEAVTEIAPSVNAGPAVPEPGVPAAEAAAETTETTPVEEVSEIEESAEAAAAPTASTPPLKLASRAVEPKVPANSAFKEGIHYQRLVPTQPTSVSADQVEIAEVFWYGCPHCFQLDTKLEAWRAGERGGKPPYVNFHRVPATWNDITVFHARVFYAAELLGKADQLHTPIFREIHVNGNALNTMDKVKAFFGSQGIATADFDRTFASFGLEAKVQNATVLMRRYKVPSVPFFVVNGKYTTSVTAAGGEDQLLQLLNELAAREQGG
jgi:protein dithiol oxidoreductase (disulfide-forming)